LCYGRRAFPGGIILLRRLSLCILITTHIWIAAPLRACELALVLAVDVSASISSGEYALQMQGLADALDDPIIAHALVKGQTALTLVQWSGVSEQDVSIPWQRILTQQDVAEFARTTQELHRKWRNGFTAIGSMLDFAAPLYLAVPDCRRLVLDVSGDGIINAGVPTRAARDMLIAKGVTINGIAIDRRGDTVNQYFRSDIIGGADAFVIPTRGYADYVLSIREKLFRELIEPVS
jgi:Ca-activated chloride channel homolog